MTKSNAGCIAKEIDRGSDFPAFVVRKADGGEIGSGIEQLLISDLPEGDVLIETSFSSLNFKDALASQGHPGVVSSFPHVPGIDCAGRVKCSSCKEFSVSDEVIVTGYGLGAESWGGYSAFVRVPKEWVVPLPAGLTMREAMILGTAGFTAAQCVNAIISESIQPQDGTVLVTGATGGVGSIAVSLLSKLGYSVAAVTGKVDQHDFLRELGASEILGREALSDDTKRPLLQSKWSAAVDTVGGKPLVNVLRSISHRGCVAACGLVAGTDLPMSIYPFILRGVKLAGIDSAKCPREPRLKIWKKFANEWKIDCLEKLTTEVGLAELPSRIDTILEGNVVGRTLVNTQIGANRS